MRLKINKRNIARATTRSGKHRVWGYGSLKNSKRSPIWARGDLYLRPTGQAAVDFEGRGWVKGDLMIVDDAGLRDLDRREGHPRVYCRILVKLRDGSVAWCYEWSQSFDGFELVKDGIWRWEHLRVWRARYGRNNTIAAPCHPATPQRRKRSATPTDADLVRAAQEVLPWFTEDDLDDLKDRLRRRARVFGL